ncbi:MAG: Rpn family recombination-promoting nuclease/putative transposase [Cyanobacteriota bacterium]
MNTDRWYYRVFQSAPDLIRSLLPGSAAAAKTLGLDPATPGDLIYRFEALELKELSHRLDGVLWPRKSTGCAETGSPEFPVVLLEVQMHPDPGFRHRLAAQSCRFLQKHPQVEHLEVVVITPHKRMSLGPTKLPRLLQALLNEVHWISLEELSQQPNLDPLLNLLTLPVRPESELAASSQQILASRPDLDTVVLPMLVQRFPQLTEEQIMVIAGIPREEIRHTRAVQDWLAEGRQEGLQEGEAREAAKVTLRQLNRRCGPLSEATTAQIQALPLEQLEALADALLDFQGPADLAAWLAANA